MNRLRLTFLIVLFAAVAQAQESNAPHPLEPSDVSSPGATLESLISSCNELQKLMTSGVALNEREGVVSPTRERILDCLDLSELPLEVRNTAGMQSALYLKEVLDRIEVPPSSKIPASGSDQSESDDWRLPGTRIAIARKQKGRYLFTSESVRRSAEFFSMVKQLPYRTTGRTTSPGLYDAYMTSTKQQPTQSTDTSSPRGTLTLFVDACNELHQLIQSEKHFDRADPEFQRLGQRIISCLDTSQLPEYSREYFDAESAVCLKEVLDRVRLPAAEQIPGIESIETSEGVEALIRWQVPHTQIAISKMQEGPRRGEFLFSAGTVARAPELYEKVRDQPYRTDEPRVSEGFYQWWLSTPGNPLVASIVDRLPDGFQTRGFGMAIWQWIGLLIAIPVSLVVMLTLFRWGRRRGVSVRERSLLQYWLSFGFFVAAVLIPIGFKYYAFEYLTLRGNAVYVVNFGCDLVFLLGILGLVVGGSSRAAESVVALPHVSATSLDANLIRIIFRVLGIVSAVIVFLEGGRYLGFPITTLIASAGIGGLAIALSAQGLVKGLFGTVTVLLDKPYRVGERIIVKGHDGFVEDIGLRSTKIRDFSNHLISIPNDQMAETEIENVGKRSHICRAFDIQIPCDTPRDLVEEAITCVRNVLHEHEGMQPDSPPRVNLTEFRNRSLIIEVVYWYSPPDRWKHAEFAERVNLEILKAFDERGVRL